jgi:hypothetical protein
LTVLGRAKNQYLYFLEELKIENDIRTYTLFGKKIKIFGTNYC